MIRYMDDGVWLDASSIEQICTLFIGANEFNPGRTKPVTLLDGRAITKTNAPLILLESAVQQHLDAKAVSRGYDNIQSAMIRAGYPGPYHTEGTKFAQWADACWVAVYAVFADIKASKREVPTVEELYEILPSFD